MENALLCALQSDAEIRVSAENYLKRLEGNPGFLWELFQTHVNSHDLTVKLSSLILAKAVISRQWYIPKSKQRPAPVPEEEKALIKDFLMQWVLFSSDINPKYLEYLILCIGAITKHSFYDQWMELQEYFVGKILNLNCVDAIVLKIVVKTQIRRRMKIKQFKEWVQRIYQDLFTAWSNSQNADIEKVLLKCLTVINDSKAVLELNLKAKGLLSIPGSEEPLRHLLKGLNLIENSNPNVFTKEILQLYLEVNYLLITNLTLRNHTHGPLIRQAVHNLREILTSSASALAMLKPLSLDLLKKCYLEFQYEEYFESWSEGDCQEILETAESKEEIHLKKLLITLLQVYPDLLIHIKEICDQLLTATLEEVHSSLLILSLLPQVFEHIQNPGISLEAIISLASKIPATGFHQKVLCRDILVIIKNWAKSAIDISVIYQTVFNIRTIENTDIVILYECFLVFKEILTFAIPAELSVSIINNFGRDIFQMLITINTPEIVWNLVSVISLLIDKSASYKTPELLQLFQAAGLNEILKTKSEMIVLSLIDMFEGLIRVYPDENIIVQSAAFFLNTQIESLVSERVIYLWHYLIAGMEAKVENLQCVNELLRHMRRFTGKYRGVLIKILEEYLFMLQLSGKTQSEMLEFINTYCAPVCEFIGDIEHDSLSLALLVSVSLIDLTIVSHHCKSFLFYLAVENNSSACTLCILASVRLLNKLVINYPEVIDIIDLPLWISKMTVQSSSNHKKLSAVALLKNFEKILAKVPETADTLFDLTVPLVENFLISNNSENKELVRKKVSCSQLCPSPRKANFMNSDHDTKENILLLFKQAMGTSAAFSFRMGLTEEKNGKVEEILKSRHSRSISK